MPKTIRIRESYSQFEDRFRFRSIVEEALGAAPPRCLAGIDSVLLRDIGSLSKDERRSKSPSRKGDAGSLQRVKGLYYAPSAKRGARIELYSDNILREWPRIAFMVPPFRDFVVVRVLYHEIGHHMHSFVEPKRGEIEMLAEEWERKLVRSYLLDKFMIARVVRKVLLVLSRLGIRWSRRSAG